MSEYIHTAIIVTGSAHNFDEDGVRSIVKAIQKAEEFGLTCTGITPGRNGFDSFMVAPSGSAGGLHPSNAEGERGRALFVQYLREQGTRLEWVEVLFGREHGRAEILADCTDASSMAAMKWGARFDPRRLETARAELPRGFGHTFLHAPATVPEHEQQYDHAAHEAHVRAEIARRTMEQALRAGPQPTGTCHRCGGAMYGQLTEGMPCVKCCEDRIILKGDHE